MYAEQELFALFAIFSSFFMLLGFLILVCKIFQYLGGYKTFEKMNIEGWKYLIPLYRDYVIFDFFKMKNECIVYFSLIAASVIFGKNESVQDACGLLVLLLTFYINYRISKGFGHGILFAIGLTLLPPVFLMILGFNKDVFVYIEEDSLITKMENNINARTVMVEDNDSLEIEDEIIYCPRCGAALIKEDKFCSQCGQDLSKKVRKKKSENEKI